MQALLDKLASAIATGEGFFAPNSLPSRDNNPGDIRLDALNKDKVVGGFVIFSSKARGIADLYHQIALDIFRGYSLRQLIYAWAPPSDGNNSENYLNETARRIGLTKDQVETPLWNFLEINFIP